MLRCSYCNEKIRDDARLGLDLLIMPVLQRDKKGKIKKSKSGILMNKIACRECIGRIWNEEIEM